MALTSVAAPSVGLTFRGFLACSNEVLVRSFLCAGYLQLTHELLIRVAAAGGRHGRLCAEDGLGPLRRRRRLRARAVRLELGLLNHT